MAQKQKELSNGEWTILKAVWANEPCAAPTIQEELEKETNWTYSTVKTMMDRMVQKGFLKTERIRNLILYRAAITEKQAKKGELLRTAKRAFDGAFTPMMQFLVESKTLKQNDLDELEALIKKAKKKNS